MTEKHDPFTINVQPGHPMHSGQSDQPEEKTIEFASTEQVNDLGPKVDRVLIALAHVTGEPGIAHAFITDESTISDFCPDAAQIATMARDLGIEVAEDDYLVEVAARLP